MTSASPDILSTLSTVVQVVFIGSSLVALVVMAKIGPLMSKLEGIVQRITALETAHQALSDNFRDHEALQHHPATGQALDDIRRSLDHLRTDLRGH